MGNSVVIFLLNQIRRSLQGCITGLIDTLIDRMIKRIRTKKKISPHLKNGDSKYLTPTAPNDPVLPGLFVFQGMRGSGKTYAAVMMCRHFEVMGYIQRTFLLCPTADDRDQKDTIYTNLKTLKQNDVCTDIGDFEKALAQVEQRVKADWKQYEEFLKHQKAHTKYQNREALDVEEISVLEQFHFLPPSRVIKPKRHMLILDNCQGSNVYTTSRAGMLNHLAIKHRHIPLTICFLVQSWVGCPRTIRLNATQYCIFKTGDQTQLEQIYSCFANTITKEEFLHVYREATSQKHGFLFIDVVPKHPWMRFRAGFNEFLSVEDDGEIRSLETGQDIVPEKHAKRLRHANDSQSIYQT